MGYFKQPLYRFGTEEDFNAVEALEREEIRQKAEANALKPPPAEPRHHFVVGDPLSNKAGKDPSSFRAFSGLLFRRRMAKVQKPTSEMKKQRVGYAFSS